MAKVRNNIIIRGLSGDLGKQLRIRTGKISGLTNAFAIAGFGTEREDSPAQEAHKQAVREAAAYANANKENPIYVAIAKGKERQAKNVAMADWFHPPRILVLEIDLRGWRGAAGQVIRVLAVDDVQVAQVHVEITDGADTILETGQAALAVTQRWEYPLQQAHSGTVTVFARDLPGHVTQESVSKKLPGPAWKRDIQTQAWHPDLLLASAAVRLLRVQQHLYVLLNLGATSRPASSAVRCYSW